MDGVINTFIQSMILILKIIIIIGFGLNTALDRPIYTKSDPHFSNKHFRKVANGDEPGR